MGAALAIDLGVGCCDDSGEGLSLCLREKASAYALPKSTDHSIAIAGISKEKSLQLWMRMTMDAATEARRHVVILRRLRLPNAVLARIQARQANIGIEPNIPASSSHCRYALCAARTFQSTK